MTLKSLCLSLSLTLALPFTVHAGESPWEKPRETLPVMQEAPTITVYRSEYCGCCKDWLTHLKQHGFNVIDTPTEQMSAIKEKLGVTPQLASCHTGVVDGYVVEGHVPADDIKRLLKTRPKIAGIAVPGMPHGSPGMETGRKDDFHVVAFDKKGNTDAFNTYRDY